LKQEELEFDMTMNVGTLDRLFRVVLGLALIGFALWSAVPYAWLGYIGIVPLLTAAIGSCPVYSLLGVSTCPVKKA
jgi:hypothetical protein